LLNFSLILLLLEQDEEKERKKINDRERSGRLTLA
jgi:hypothetical protein